MSDKEAVIILLEELFPKRIIDSNPELRILAERYYENLGFFGKIRWNLRRIYLKIKK